jgi:ribosomal protein S18 acetylase RimI-like enzyme
MTGLILRNGDPRDDVALAAVHAAAFPDYFQTHMGPGFLRRFYSAFLRPGHLVVVAVSGGRIVGLVAGTDDLRRLQRDLYPPNLVPFAATFVAKVLTDRVVRRSAMSRLGHLRVAVASIFARDRTESVTVSGTGDSTMYLFSICIDPSEQGAGIAAPLLDEFKRSASAKGSKRVELTVVDDNDRAIRFYEREGWTQTKHLGTTFEYSIDL